MILHLLYSANIIAYLCLKIYFLKMSISQVYINWMYMIFMYLIPFGLLAFFNIQIYREVQRANSLRAHLTRSQKKEIRLVMMLFCVVIIFFLCNSLALVISIMEVRQDCTSRDHEYTYRSPGGR